MYDSVDNNKEEKIMPVSIHGKEYFTVAERLNEMNKETEGNYTLQTKLVHFESGVAVFKATLTVQENTYTGHAMEKEGSSTINKTSFLECAETSAIGRALASAGYLGSEFASADEVATAIKNQEEKLATDKQKWLIDKICNDHGLDSTQYITDDLTNLQASKTIKELKGE